MKKYDIAAYIWPAYTGDEPRTRLFWPEGIGEWQTVKNSAPELLIGAQLAKKKGARLVTCCLTHGTPLDELSDIAVYGYTQPISPNQLFGSTSRLGLTVITRTIVEYMMSQGD